MVPFPITLLTLNYRFQSHGVIDALDVLCAQLTRDLFAIAKFLLNFWENCVFAFWRQDPRWRISATLDFRGPIMGSLKTPCTNFYRSPIDIIPENCLVFENIAFLDFGVKISAILDFSGPIMGFLKSPCTTSYRSSMEIIALNCLVFEKIAFFCILATDGRTDRQTDKQIDSTDALSRSRCRERRLNKVCW